MKAKIMMLFAGLSLAVIACSDAAKDTTDNDTTTNSTTTTTTPDAGTTTTSVDVPPPTRTSFETKYPNASNVRWSRYQPTDRSTMDPSDWNYRLDTNDYEVMFNWDGSDY